MASRAIRWISRPSQALLSKDIKLFLRDPVQTLQFLVFFGFLGVYFLNIAKIHAIDIALWKNLLSFLNMFAICAIMVSLGLRFLFPLISLEGRAFWVTGLR